MEIILPRKFQPLMEEDFTVDSSLRRSSRGARVGVFLSHDDDPTATNGQEGGRISGREQYTENDMRSGSFYVRGEFHFRRLIPVRNPRETFLSIFVV